MGAWMVKSGENTNPSVKAFVDEEIEENKIIVFSKTYCSYSNMAKKALSEVGAQFKVVELDNRNDGSAIQDYLAQITGSSTVPRVFINGKFIGGGSETKALQRSGELSAMVNGVS